MSDETLPLHKDSYLFIYGIDIDKPIEMANQIISLKEKLQEKEDLINKTKEEIRYLKSNYDISDIHAQKLIQILDNMSKITLHECDMCGSVVKQSIKKYTNSMVCDLCDNCYKDISILEDMKHIHNIAISEINEMINKKVEGMKDERKEDII